jgi:hypothetical protein
VPSSAARTVAEPRPVAWKPRYNVKRIPYEVSFLQGHSDRSESPDFVEIEFFSLGVMGKKAADDSRMHYGKEYLLEQVERQRSHVAGRTGALKVSKWLGSTWTGSFVAALARLSSPVSSIHVRLMRMLAVCTTTLLAVGHLLAGGGFLAPRLGAG